MNFCVICYFSYECAIFLGAIKLHLTKSKNRAKIFIFKELIDEYPIFDMINLLNFLIFNFYLLFATFCT